MENRFVVSGFSTEQDTFVLSSIETGPTVYPSFYLVDTEGSFSGRKWQGVKINDYVRLTYIPLYVFTVCTKKGVTSTNPLY